jgi:hypothetical protein
VCRFAWEMKRSNSGCFACFGGGLDLEELEAGKWDEATHSRVRAGNMPAQPAWKSLKAGADPTLANPPADTARACQSRDGAPCCRNPPKFFCRARCAEIRFPEQSFDVLSFSPGDVKPLAEVLPGIFLGSVHAAADHTQLKSRGITHILNLVSAPSTPPAPPHPTPHCVPLHRAMNPFCWMGPSLHGCVLIKGMNGGGQQRRVPTRATESQGCGQDAGKHSKKNNHFQA